MTNTPDKSERKHQQAPEREAIDVGAQATQEDQRLKPGALPPEPAAPHEPEHPVEPQPEPQTENPPRTTTGGWFTAPKFGSAGSGGAEIEPGIKPD